MKSRLLGFLKQAKNRTSDGFFSTHRHLVLFPHRCRLLKNSGRLIQAEYKRKQLCLQTELAEEKITIISLIQVTAVSTTNLCHEKKVVTLNVIKKFCMQARIWLEIF